MRPVALLPVLVALFVAPAAFPPASAQAPDSPFAGPFVVRSSPAPAGSAEPNLAVSPDGTVWMSWQERLADHTSRLRVARRAEEGWSEPPVTVAEGRFFANWADFPSIFFTRDGTLAAHWLERDGQGTYAYGVRVRTSRDGRTWTDAIIPHSDRSPTEHGFVAFYEDPASGLGLVWLDGRETAGGHGGGGTMTLRSASIVDGRPANEQLVDPKVCDCCQTAAAATDEGVVVAYRDRTDDEIRDMSVVRLVNGRWTTPSTLHADGWKINACPVNGPVLAAQGRTVAAAWFTAAGGTSRTRLAFSTDAGATFGTPIELSSGSATMGRVGILMIDPDRVLVSSLERGSEGGQLVIRQVRRDGRVSAPVVVTATSPERASGFARMALDRERRLFVAWTEVTRGSPPQVRIADAPIR
jgi:hypothetical protein